MTTLSLKIEYFEVCNFFQWSVFLPHVFFYKHDVYKHIQSQVWWFFKHMLSIMLSLAKYYYVKYLSG